MSLNSFKTKSGKPVTIGSGTGTKWKAYRTQHPQEFQNGELHQELVDIISDYLTNGFNHIDAAEAYETHHEVGAGVRQSGVAREDIWITDKFSTFGKLVNGPYDAIKSSLEKIGTDYFDLYLIHTPFFSKEANGLSLEEAWAELERAHEEGLVVNVGVSNFSIENLKHLKKFSKYDPKANQIEFHAHLQNQSDDIVAYCQENGIVVESYGPLSPLFRFSEGDLAKDILPKLAAKYNKTSAQILLRWTLQENVLPITTSSKLERIKEAADIHHFELSQEDQNLITQVGKKQKSRAFFVKEFKNYDTKL